MYTKLAGQDAWSFLTEDSGFYLEIIDMIDTDPATYLEYNSEYNNAVLSFLEQLKEMTFIKSDGTIDWKALFAFNSGKKLIKTKKKK